MKEAGNTEEGREFQRWEVDGKKPSPNLLILTLESSTQQLWANVARRVERGRAIGVGIQAATSSEQ